MRHSAQSTPSRQATSAALSPYTRFETPARFISGLTNAVVMLGLGLVGLSASLPNRVYELYPIENTLRPAADRPLLLIDAHGKPFAERGDCTAESVTLSELPPHFIDAVLAMEDRRFYAHPGLDPIGILRAARRNYNAGTIREGGSTITQQLVKLTYLTNERTFERKIKEAFLSLWLEIRLSKDQILERYLSSVYFGKGCYGVRAASKKFFDKPVGQLSLAESVFMVALLSSPSQLTNNSQHAQERARLVLAAMVEDGRLSEEEAASVRGVELRPDLENEAAGYYADWLAELVHGGLTDRHSRQLLRVHTTFDPLLQQFAQAAIVDTITGTYEHSGQVALVAMRTDGRVLAMVGGRNWSFSEFNRAVDAMRQPGSAFKTFVYLTVIQAGVSPHSVVSDKPIAIDGWEPQNFTGRFRGAYR